MTQTSLFWINNGTGDGVNGGYTQSQLVEWLRSMFAKGNNAGGVSPEYLNELAVTGTSSPVAVASGAAICYGFPYINTSSENVTVATPSGATRIDCIVLRVNWAAQTVRITRIAGTEGGGAPSLTQSAGTTWDIPLAQVSVTTGGVITLTDQREWLDVTGDGVVTAAKLASNAVETAKIKDANVTAAKLASDSVTTTKILDANVTAAKMAANSVATANIVDANVTTAKIANDAVDDTKVGDRVLQFHRRKGGDSSIWGVPGTTNYTPGAVRMQAGSVRWTGSATSGNTTVSFPVAFSGLPIILATATEDGGGNPVTVGASYANSSSSQAYLKWQSTTTVTSVTINWLAIGPE